MKKRLTKRKPLKPLAKYCLIGTGCAIAFLGVASLAMGSLHYTNYWGGAVFAPYAIIVGGLLILTAARWGK